MTIIHSEQLVLRQKLLDLMLEVLSEKADAFFLYGCLVPGYRSLSCFYTVDGTPFELFTRVDNPLCSSDEQVELQCKGQAIMSTYFNEFMTFRDGQDSPPSELYFTYDMQTKEETFRFGYKLILNYNVPVARYEAWFVSQGWEPLPEWNCPLIWRLKNWLKRDDPFQWCPSIADVLADPPWEKPYVKEIGE